MMDEADTPQATGLPNARRDWIRPAVFGVVMLLCGAVIGSGLTVIGVRKEAERVKENPRWLSETAAKRMDRDLDLTDEQSVRVREIFSAHHERVRAIRREHHGRARELFGELQSEIEAVLTLEQAEEWRERMQRLRERALKDGDGPRHRREGSGRDVRPGHGDGGEFRDGPPSGRKPSLQ